MKAEKYRWHYLDFYMQHRILMIIIMWHNVICINLWISFSCNALRRCKENNYNVTEYHGLFWLWKCNSTRNFFKRLGGKDKALETRVKISRYFQFPFFFPLTRVIPSFSHFCFDTCCLMASCISTTQSITCSLHSI